MSDLDKARQYFGIGQYADVVAIGAVLEKTPEGRMLLGEALLLIGGEDAYEKVLECFSKEAEAGEPVAMLRLAFLYDRRTSFPNTNLDAVRVKDDFLANYWYRKAFERLVELASVGDACAMRELAQMYETGDAGEKDVHKAYFWYKKSFERGMLVSANELMLYHSDEGGDFFSPELARDYYRKAKEANTLCSKVPEWLKKSGEGNV